jgi:hypothetical protein
MKLPILTIFVMTCEITFAQLWFDAGLKGGMGTGFLINKTLTNDDRLNVTPGRNTIIGGKFGVNFGKENGITLDLSYNHNTFSFLQSGIIETKQSFAYTINYSTLNFAPLYRHTTEAQYLELGPEFLFFRKGHMTDEVYPNSIIEADGKINPSQFGAIFGFGGYIIGNDVIALSLGLRIRYSISNLISDEYSTSNYPFVNYPDISTGNRTNPLSIQAVFELNYSLAQFARASCGKRVALIRF